MNSKSSPDSWRSRLDNRLKVLGQFRDFLIFWLSQSLSQIGTSVTSFGLGIWIYQQTEAVTQLSLVFFVTTLPGVLLTPLIGALVDRWNRRWIIFFSDCFAALITLVLLVLLLEDRLAIWHTYVSAFFTSLCGCFQMVAKGAAIPTLVSKAQLRQVNGLLQLSNAVSSIAAPSLAAILIAKLQIEGLLSLDLATYALGAIAILLIAIPQPESLTTEDAIARQKPSLLFDIREGGKIIASQRGFIFLIAVISLHSAIKGLVNVLMNPLILSFASTQTLGTVISVGSGGMVIGSILLSLWKNEGSPLTFLLAWSALNGLGLVVAGIHASVNTIAAGLFIWFLTLPFIFGTNQAIWQSYVEPRFQGRILSLVGSVTGLATAIGTIGASPLTDGLLEPLMRESSWLTALLGYIFGTGRGRGIGVLISFDGVIVTSLSVIALLLFVFWKAVGKRLSLNLEFDPEIASQTSQNQS